MPRYLGGKAIRSFSNSGFCDGSAVQAPFTIVLSKTNAIYDALALIWVHVVFGVGAGAAGVPHCHLAGNGQCRSLALGGHANGCLAKSMPISEGIQH